MKKLLIKIMCGALFITCFLTGCSCSTKEASQEPQTSIVTAEDKVAAKPIVPDKEILLLMQQGYIFPGLNDDDGCYYDDEDDPNLVWPIPNKEKKGKNKRNDDDAYAQYWEKEERKAKKKHKKGKNARIININDPYSGDEENPTEYASYEDLESDGINDGKLIYFYPKYRNKEDRLEFNTLREFDDFCADYGYAVPPYVGEEIAYRRISHVCLRPDAREYGMFEIMAEESYADMMYEACDTTELSQ